MIETLAPDVENIATLVVLLLPGFVFIALFEATNLAFAKRRSGWEWGMLSLTLSLPLFAIFTGIYRLAGWPRDPVDPQFYLGLFGGAMVAGYVTGSFSRTRLARTVLQGIGFSDPRRTWVDVVGQPDSYITIHLIDGTVLFGYPANFTDDPRIDTREIFLTEVSRLLRKDDADPGVWKEFEQTDGVLVDSSRINFIQLVSRPSNLSDRASE